MILFVLLSVTISSVCGQTDSMCDCQEVAMLKQVVQEVLIEQRLESARLSKLEARLGAYETTGPIPNDRLAMLEQNVNDINMKFNETVTGTKSKQIGLHRDIGAIVKKTLISEKEERNKLVSDLNKKVIEHKDIIETFKVEVNNTIEKRFHNITAEQVEYMDTIETFKVAINNTIEKRFLDITAEQVEYIDSIETFKVAINNTVDKHFQNITAEQVKYRDEVKDMLNSTETLVRTVFNNISKVDNEVLDLYKRTDNIKEVNKTIERISSDLISVDQNLKKTRDMVDTLGEVAEGKVRLVGGSFQYEGRLEIWHDWSWGTICDDEFTTLSAQVACKMLQYPSISPVVFGSAHFGAGTAHIHLDDVKCLGREKNLIQCAHRGWGENNCGHGEDVGISCTKVRLVGGSNKHEGRLEIWYGGSWGTVCDDGFTKQSAKVVCVMMDYPYIKAEALENAHFGAGTLPIHLDDVKCSGVERSLFYCRHSSWGENNCSHDEDVGIKCK